MLSYHTQNETSLNLTWQAFSMALGVKNIKPRPYIVDTIKHLISAAIGSVPAFIPSIDNSAAPIDTLSDVYSDIYRIKKYRTTFMQPYNLLPNNEKKPIYYSLSMPIVLEGYSLDKIPPQIMTDLREIKYVLNTLQQTAQQDKLEFSIHRAFNTIGFKFFHTEKDIHHEIISASQLPNLDTTFNYCTNTGRNQHFCDSSRFLNGCIQITVHPNSE